MKNLNLNLEGLYNGTIAQRQTSLEERSYYFGLREYKSDPQKYQQQIYYDE